MDKDRRAELVEKLTQALLFGFWDKLSEKEAIANAAYDSIRAEVLEELAKVAESNSSYSEVHSYFGLPAWWKHGKEIAAWHRALKDAEQK